MSLHIHDIAPTVLALLGFPVADDMDGDAARELVNAAFWKDHPIRRVERYRHDRNALAPEPADELDEGQIETLRALGYLD